MSKHLRFALACMILFGVNVFAAPSFAQATRTWISGVGDDVNPCSRTAPCKTFAGAISKTAVNGEINCLDPGGFGGVTITKSITLDCHDVYGSILVAGTNGITIAFDSFSDANKSVRIRNVNFSGTATGLNGIRIIGGAASAGSKVFIEDCMIDGFQGNPGRGISDERTGGGKIFIANTTVRNNAGTGITVNPAAGAATGAQILAVLDNVRSENNSFGIAAGSAVKMVVNRSVTSGNTGGGLYAEATFVASELNVNDTVVSGNATGAQNAGGSVTIRLSNSDFAFNGTALGGASTSFGNNRISGPVGTTPTLGAASSDHGQQ